MTIPKPDTIETVIHQEKEQLVLIHSVQHEKGTMWRVWVEPQLDVFQNLDTVYWRDADGKQHQTYVRDLQRGGGIVRFVVLAGEDW